MRWKISSTKSGKLVSILILLDYLLLYYGRKFHRTYRRSSQSLFYWIIYSYPFCRESPPISKFIREKMHGGLNPYFIGLSTLIWNIVYRHTFGNICLNPYFIGLSTLILQDTVQIIQYLENVSILILLDYLLLSSELRRQEG